MTSKTSLDFEIVSSEASASNSRDGGFRNRARSRIQRGVAGLWPGRTGRGLCGASRAWVRRRAQPRRVGEGLRRRGAIMRRDGGASSGATARIARPGPVHAAASSGDHATVSSRSREDVGLVTMPSTSSWARSLAGRSSGGSGIAPLTSRVPGRDGAEDGHSRRLDPRGRCRRRRRLAAALPKNVWDGLPRRDCARSGSRDPPVIRGWIAASET